MTPEVTIYAVQLMEEIVEAYYNNMGLHQHARCQLKQKGQPYTDQAIADYVAKLEAVKPAFEEVLEGYRQASLWEPEDFLNLALSIDRGEQVEILH